jgi:hypothetical protein
MSECGFVSMPTNAGTATQTLIHILSAEHMPGLARLETSAFFSRHGCPPVAVPMQALGFDLSMSWSGKPSTSHVV